MELIPCSHAEADRLPLDLTRDERIFKLYFLDIGLLLCILRLDYLTLISEMDRLTTSRGVITEQFVAQTLASIYGQVTVPMLNYWLRDKGSQKGEVDFLIQEKDEVIPIEVKAGQSGKLKSLFYFAHEKKWSNAVKISLEWRFQGHR